MSPNFTRFAFASVRPRAVRSTMRRRSSLAATGLVLSVPTSMLPAADGSFVTTSGQTAQFNTDAGTILEGAAPPAPTSVTFLSVGTVFDFSGAIGIDQRSNVY
jgi:hypothetical protein